LGSKEEKKEEKKEPPKPVAAPAGSLWKGILRPSVNYPESEEYSLRNTYVGRWSHKWTSIPNKIPKHADLCTEIIKRTYLKDKLVKDFFEGFDLGKQGGYELSKEGLITGLWDLGIEKKDEEYDSIYDDFFKTE